VGDSVAQMYQGGQQPVDKHQSMPGAHPDCPLAWSIGQPCVLTRLPARSQLGQDHRGQARDTAIGDR
jgi:hypothetical protein